MREQDLDLASSCSLLFAVLKYLCEQSSVPTNIHKQQIWALAKGISSENKTCFLIKWHSFWEKAMACKKQTINMGTDITPRDWSQHSAAESWLLNAQLNASALDCPKLNRDVCTQGEDKLWSSVLFLGRGVLWTTFGVLDCPTGKLSCPCESKLKLDRVYFNDIDSIPQIHNNSWV